jgi:hypothetical protein
MRKRTERLLLPRAEYLRELFAYDPLTGSLVWKRRPREHFPTQRACSTWNARYSGKEALAAVNKSSGHLFGSIDNRHFLKQRVIWKLVTGEEPPLIVDHRDRDPTNNQWNNLRAATKSQNNINSGLKRGVSFDKSRGLWAAYTKLNGKKVHLGRHKTEAQARQARELGVRRYFGEFAP